MSKEIKITLYTPKELWKLFCNRVFWPRNKKCTEWCDYYDGVLDSDIVDILQQAVKDGLITDEAAETLEIKLKEANDATSKLTAKMMSEPY
jgi:hypothetical protein